MRRDHLAALSVLVPEDPEVGRVRQSPDDREFGPRERVPGHEGLEVRRVADLDRVLARPAAGLADHEHEPTDGERVYDIAAHLEVSPFPSVIGFCDQGCGYPNG